MPTDRKFISTSEAAEPFFVGVDVGGTTIKIGVVDNLGRPLSWVSIQTDSDKGPAEGAERIAKAIKKAAADAKLTLKDIVYVGLGTPGSDADIHAEFMLPEKGAGNSGLYIHGNYELQIINSLGKKNPDQNDIGAIYGFHPPLVNACRKPGEWQVYDIRYRAPRRDADGKITEEGSITAWLNGQKVQEGANFGEPRSPYHPYRYGSSPYLQAIWKQQQKTSVGPLFLQDHDSPVRFRNVWIRPLDDLATVYDPK